MRQANGVWALGLGLWALSATAADLKDFKYRLPGFPKLKADCNLLAGELADKLKAAVKVDVDVALCTKETTDGYDIEIRYRAEAPLPRLSTWPLTVGYLHGRYTKKEDCQAKLPGDIEIFQTQTGVPAIFAYCRKEGVTDDRDWGIQIEGFGEAKRDYRMGAFQIFALPKDPAAIKMRDRIQTDLDGKMSKFVDIRVASHGPYADIIVHYYADAQRKFEMYDSLRMQREEECQAQVTEFNTAFVASPIPPAFSYCARTTVGGGWEIDSLFIGGLPYRYVGSQELFKGYADCRAALPGLKTKYATALKKDIKALFCTINEEGREQAIIFYQ